MLGAIKHGPHTLTSAMTSASDEALALWDASLTSLENSQADARATMRSWNGDGRQEGHCPPGGNGRCGVPPHGGRPGGEDSVLVRSHRGEGADEYVCSG